MERNTLEEERKRCTRAEFRSEACAPRLGWIRGSIPIEMLLPLPPHLSLYWALSPPSPCAICPLPGGRWRRGRGESVHEGIHRQEEEPGITVNCYFCKQNDFILPTGENTTGAGNVDSELLDRKLVDEIQRGSNSNYSRCCSYICSS